MRRLHYKTDDRVLTDRDFDKVCRFCDSKKYVGIFKLIVDNMKKYADYKPGLLLIELCKKACLSDDDMKHQHNKVVEVIKQNVDDIICCFENMNYMLPKEKEYYDACTTHADDYTKSNLVSEVRHEFEALNNKYCNKDADDICDDCLGKPTYREAIELLDKCRYMGFIGNGQYDYIDFKLLAEFNKEQVSE